MVPLVMLGVKSLKKKYLGKWKCSASRILRGSLNQKSTTKILCNIIV